MNAKQNQKILELDNAQKNLMLWFKEIQRLMPEVEAELFRMSRVGAAHGKKPLKSNEEMEMRIRKKFNSTTKIKT